MQIFRGVEFHEAAGFGRLVFHEESFYQFFATIFQKKANLSGVEFQKMVKRRGSVFHRNADFRGVEFHGKTDFNEAIFKESSNFAPIQFKDIVMFDYITGFSNMKMECGYDFSYDYLLKNLNKNVNKEYRGLRDHLKYNEPFYIALIKNYKEMGWLTEADDAYYTYRGEKRIHDLKEPWKSMELIVLKESFGYGVKPLKLARAFLIPWILFSFLYLRLICIDNTNVLRNQFNCYSRIKSSKWNPTIVLPILFKIIINSRLFWCILHSLDTMLPGINLHSMKIMPPYKFKDGKSYIYLHQIQQLIGWYLLY